MPRYKALSERFMKALRPLRDPRRVREHDVRVLPPPAHDSHVPNSCANLPPAVVFANEHPPAHRPVSKVIVREHNSPLQPSVRSLSHSGPEVRPRISREAVLVDSGGIHEARVVVGDAIKSNGYVLGGQKVPCVPPAAQIDLNIMGWPHSHATSAQEKNK